MEHTTIPKRFRAISELTEDQRDDIINCLGSKWHADSLIKNGFDEGSLPHVNFISDGLMHLFSIQP